MDENIQLVASTAPHLRDEDSVSMIMYSVVWALVPATLSAVYFFRGQAVGIILTCTIVALVAEVLAQRLRGVPATLWDGSALVTGLAPWFELAADCALVDGCPGQGSGDCDRQTSLWRVGA